MSQLNITVGTGSVQVVQLGTISAAAQAQLASIQTTVNTISQSALLQWAYGNIFQLVSAMRDVNEAIVTASIVWPDGATGTFTTDAVDSINPAAINAWHATHVLGGITKTVTQPAVTRDTNGAVTAQPAITIA